MSPNKYQFGLSRKVTAGNQNLIKKAKTLLLSEQITDTFKIICHQFTHTMINHCTTGKKKTFKKRREALVGFSLLPYSPSLERKNRGGVLTPRWSERVNGEQ